MTCSVKHKMEVNNGNEKRTQWNRTDEEEKTRNPKEMSMEMMRMEKQTLLLL